MHLRFTRWLVAAIVATCLAPAAAAAQDGPPPPPTAADGAPVTTLAQGLGTPTSFAFGGGVVFAGTAPSEAPDGPVGGVYALKGGKATAVAGFPPIVFGLAWRKGTLYASSGKNLYAASGWDGAKFAKVKAIYKGAKTFTGFGGLAFGPNGRLYAGVALDPKFDHKLATSPFGQSVVSMKPNGKDIEVVAGGLRQPWQLTFVKGNDNPYVTVLAQDNLKDSAAGLDRGRQAESELRLPDLHLGQAQALSRAAQAAGAAAGSQLADGHRRDRPEALRRHVRRPRQGTGRRLDDREGQADQAVPERVRRAGRRARHPQGDRLRRRPHGVALQRQAVTGSWKRPQSAASSTTSCASSRNEALQVVE